MGFIERELDRIGATLCSEPDAPDYDRLYAAQQALAWAMDPTGFASPIKHIRPDTQEDSRDCPGCPDPTPAA